MSRHGLASWLAVLSVLSLGLLACGGGDEPSNAPGGGSGGQTAAGSPGSSAGSGLVSGAATGGGGAGNQSGSGGSTSAGSGAISGGGSTGDGAIFTAEPSLCEPSCGTGKFCAAVVTSGCVGGASCSVEAECRDAPACTPGDQARACPQVGLTCLAPGYCRCNQGKACDDGMEFDFNPQICRCVPTPAGPSSCLDMNCADGFKCDVLLGRAVCVKSAP